MIDFVTTAPMSCNGKNCANSLPLLAQPLAVKTGAGNQALPKVVERSMLIHSPAILDQLNPIELKRHP